MIMNGDSSEGENLAGRYYPPWEAICLSKYACGGGFIVSGLWRGAHSYYAAWPVPGGHHYVRLIVNTEGELVEVRRLREKPNRLSDQPTGQLALSAGGVKVLKAGLGENLRTSGVAIISRNADDGDVRRALVAAQREQELSSRWGKLTLFQPVDATSHVFGRSATNPVRLKEFVDYLLEVAPDGVKEVSACKLRIGWVREVGRDLLDQKFGAQNGG